MSKEVKNEGHLKPNQWAAKQSMCFIKIYFEYCLYIMVKLYQPLCHLQHYTGRKLDSRSTHSAFYRSLACPFPFLRSWASQRQINNNASKMLCMSVLKPSGGTECKWQCCSSPLSVENELLRIQLYSLSNRGGMQPVWMHSTWAVFHKV